MSLGPPPAPTSLQRLPRWKLAGRSLHRVYRASRPTPWWFATMAPGADADAHGRFDLPAPYGTCYLALTAVAAVLETFGEFHGRLPDEELRLRKRAAVHPPADAPVAADVAAAASRAEGVTATLWAGGDRALTQHWARELHRAGWRAVHHGISHDPVGRLRAVALFDTAGEHPPYDDQHWLVDVHTLHDDDLLARALLRYGITISRSDPQLPVVTLEESELL